MADEVTDDEVRQSLDRIVKCGVLGDGSRLPALLRFIVEEELAGHGASLKAYTIATVVFLRGADFDPSTDSIVRVEFSRLRQLLATYRLLQGKSDPVLIDVPSGGYRPKFSRVAVMPEDESQNARESKAGWVPFFLGLALAALVAAATSLGFHTALNSGVVSFEMQKPSVLVEPVRYNGNDNAALGSASLLHDYLLVAATRNLNARILDARARQITWNALSSEQLTLHMTLEQRSGKADLLVRLVAPDGEQLWTQRYDDVATVYPGWEKGVIDRLVSELRERLEVADDTKG